MLLSVLQIIVRPISEKHKHFSISVDIYKEQFGSGIQPALFLTPRNATIPLSLAYRKTIWLTTFIANMVCITKCHADTVPFLGSFLFQLSLSYGGGGAVQNLSTYVTR